MKITYAPEDGERQEFIFRPADIYSFEAELIEECGGQSWSTFEEFGDRLMDRQFKARRAALWIMLRRTNPTLRFSELVVKVPEVGLELEPDEIERLREYVANNPFLSDQEREEGLAEIDAAMAREPGKGEPAEPVTDG